MVKRGAARGSKAGGLLSQRMHNPTFPKKHRASLTGHGRQPEENYKPTNFYVDERLYIPVTDEMRGKLRQAESSICNKIINMSVGELTEFMVGAEAYRKITNTLFLSTMLDHIRDFKKVFTEKLDYVKGLTHFSTYSPHEDLESQKLIHGNVLNFLRTINKNLLPLWLVPHEKGERNHVLECMAKALTQWREGEKLISKYSDVPFAKEKLGKLRPQLGAFPPNEVADLIHGIGTNLTKFVGLLYVHVFRLFVVKSVDGNGMVGFYTLETWNALKEKAANEASASEGPSETTAAENGNSEERVSKKKKRKSAAVEEEVETEEEAEKLKKKRKRSASSTLEKEEESPTVTPKKVKKEKKDDENLITLSDDEEPTPPGFDIRKVKNEFDGKKVKMEKTDQMGYGMDHMNMPLGAEASLRMETASRTSSTSCMPPPMMAPPVPVVAPPNQFPDLDRVLDDADKDKNLPSNWRTSLWMMSCRIRDLSGIKDNLQTMARNQETMIMQREQKIAEQDNTIRGLRHLLEFHNIRPPAFM